MTKTLNYRYGGETHAITLRPYVPFYADKTLTVRSDGQNWYAPLVTNALHMPSDIQINFGGTTYRVGTNPDAVFTSTPAYRASQCTVIAANADFSDDDAYTSLNRIYATQDNSSIVGNINANYIYPAGGDENFFVGGGGVEHYYLHNSSALIVDFGIGTTKRGDGTSLATSSADTSYNPLDTGSYQCGSDQLNIFGTVTGFYLDITTAGSKQTAVVDCAITYSDENDNPQVVLCPNIAKGASKYGSNPTYDTNADAVGSVIVYVDGSTRLVSTAIKAIEFAWDDFPTDLRPKLIRLYQMFNQSGYYSTFGNTESVHQALPDWITSS